MKARDVSLTGIPNIGKATVVGALIGAVSVALPVGAFLLAMSGGDAMSILAGTHVGFFGGMGYGGMLGAVIQSDRWERANKGGINRDWNTSGRGEPSRRAA